MIVAPGDVQLAGRANKRNGANGPAWTARVVGACYRECSAVIRRPCHLDAATRGSAAGRVPSDVHAVAERAADIRIRGDHGLIVEMAAAVLEAEVGDGWIRLAAVG